MKKYQPTCLINLSKGFVCMVSAEDFEWLSKSKWYTHCNTGIPYACRGRWGHQGIMHREVWVKHNGRPIPRNMEIHHRNSNSLDNRIENLQLVNRQQHQALTANMKRPKLNGLPVGVSKVNSGTNPYQAHLRHRGKIKHIGVFRTAKEASDAYKNAWLELYSNLLK